jgi:aldehyde:ferredoxin oxidoreductase
MEKIVRVNMSEFSIKTEDVPDKYKYLGGRGLTSSILLEEVDPLCHPLGEDNKLVIAPGLLAGTTLSSSNRLSVGAKSPLTGGIKESNSGGVVAYKLARLGIKAIIIEGKPKSEELVTLKINKDGITFERDPEIKGCDTYYSAEKLFDKYGSKVGIMIIGSAGERKLLSACINCTDIDGEPCRNLGRGGMGAVMGSKGIKAIVVDDRRVEYTKNREPEIKSLIKEFAEALKGNIVTGEYFAKYGTSRNVLILDSFGGLPTRNFSSGTFDKAENISGERMAEIISSRGGKTTHSCMPGCTIRCSNTYVDEEGKPVVSSIEYETLCLMGSNLCIDNLDDIAVLNKLCNDYGLDTMEVGAALGVLAEAGVMEFGDGKKAIELVKEIGKGTPMGRLIASGSGICGKVYGIERVPAVKNQAMAAYDPRVIKGNGVTYATSPMGADHTYANTIVLSTNHLDPEGKVEASKNLQIDVAIMDTLGFCIFAGRAFSANPGLRERIVKAYTGWEVTGEELEELGKSIVLKEREFNKKAGFTKYHDRLPGFMRKEPLYPQNSVFDIEDEEMDGMFN